jgi:hypothetical protein
MEARVLEPGDVVTYVDEVGKSHQALVTIVHGNTAESCINVVYVSDDDTKRDSYGRQVERASSVQKQSEYTAHGRYFTV